MKPTLLVYSVLLGQILAAVLMYPEKVHQSDEVVLLLKHAVGLFIFPISPILVYGFVSKKTKEKPGYVAKPDPPFARTNRIIVTVVFLLCAAYFCYFDPQLATEDFWPTNINAYTLLFTALIGFPIVLGVAGFYKIKNKKDSAA